MTKPQKKPKVEPVAFLQVKFKNRQDLKAFYINDLNESLRRIEINILFKNEGKWDWAVIRMSLSKQIYHYYHPSSGKVRLTRDQYIRKIQKDTFDIYVIPTKEWKHRTGNQKGISYKGLKDLEEVKQYFNKDVLKILVYNKDGKVINEFDGHKFLKNG